MGRIICCGLGPGDPDLMSVRADRIVRGAKHVAYFRKKGQPGQARRIVDGMLAADVNEYPMEYPVTTEIASDDPDTRLLADFLRRMGRAAVAARARDGHRRAVRGRSLFLRLVHASAFAPAGACRDRGGRRHSRHGRLLECGRAADRACRRCDHRSDGHAAGGGARAAHASVGCAGRHEARPQSSEDRRRSPPRGSDDAWLVERGFHWRVIRLARNRRGRGPFRDRAGARAGAA